METVFAFGLLALCGGNRWLPAQMGRLYWPFAGVIGGYPHKWAGDAELW